MLVDGMDEVLEEAVSPQRRRTRRRRTRIGWRQVTAVLDVVLWAVVVALLLSRFV